MVNGHSSVFDSGLMQAFASGFSNAAQALSSLVKGRVFYTSLHHGYYSLASRKLDECYQLYNEIPRILLTTEIFGDISGKSYLYLSNNDYELLTQAVPNLDMNLKEEFAKEVDNILSAAVITKLSNQLNKKMFGDIPIMAGKVTARLEDIISDDFNEHDEIVYVNSIFFTLEGQPSVRPLFIWVFDKSMVGYRAQRKTLQPL